MTEVTEGAVSAAAAVLWPTLFDPSAGSVSPDDGPARALLRSNLRAALEAAQPFSGAAPAASRELVMQALQFAKGITAQTHQNHGFDSGCAVCQGDAAGIADTLLAAGVFREVPMQEQEQWDGIQQAKKEAER